MISAHALSGAFPRAIPGAMLGTASAGVAQEARRSVWDPETFAPGRSGERLGEWDGPMAVWAPSCLPTRLGGPHGQTESGGRVLAVNAGARAPSRVARQGVVPTDLQSLLDCQ
jgi:hypothetical protein